MNESKSISSQSDGTDTRLPYAGEFPIANRVLADGDSSDAVKCMTLTESSISAFSNYSEEEYRKWWGIQKTDRVSTSNADEPVVAASTALIHFSDIVQLIDDHQNSFQEDPLCFPFSRTLSKHLLPIVLLPFCHPVLILHLHGYPPEASKDVIVALLRLFASVYWVEKKNRDCLCYVNPEAAYSLVMELHAREVNGFRLFLSL